MPTMFAGAVAGEMSKLNKNQQGDRDRIGWLERSVQGQGEELKGKVADLTNRSVLADAQLITPGAPPEGPGPTGSPADDTNPGNFSYVRMEYFVQSKDGDNITQGFHNYIAQMALIKPTAAQRGAAILKTNWWIPQIELDDNHRFKQLRTRSAHSAHDKPIYFGHFNTVPGELATWPNRVTLTAGSAAGTDGMQFTIPTLGRRSQSPWWIPQITGNTDAANPGLRIMGNTSETNREIYVRTPAANYTMAEARTSGGNVILKYGSTVKTLAEKSDIPTIPTIPPAFTLPVEVIHGRDLGRDRTFLTWGSDSRARVHTATLYEPTNGWTWGQFQTRGRGTRDEVYVRFAQSSDYRRFDTFRLAKFSDIPTASSGNLTGRWTDTDNNYPSGFEITLPNRSGSASRTIGGHSPLSSYSIVTGRQGTQGSRPTHPHIYIGSQYASVSPIPTQIASAKRDGYDRAFVRIFTVNNSGNVNGYNLWYWDSPDSDKFMVQGSRITSGTGRNRIRIRVGGETGYIRSSAIIWD